MLAMKNMKTVLVLAAVMAMAGTAFADWSITVVRNADPADGLESYTLHTAGLNAFEALTIEGVHQTNSVFLGTATATNFQGDIPAGLPLMEVADSHLLFTANDIVAAGFVANETNDSSDPASIGPIGGGWEYGMGSFLTTGGFAMAGNVAEVMAGLDLMQVVIPAGETVYLFGKITSPDMGMHDLATQGGIEIGGAVPEPGAILLLLAGSLCLLGVRMHK